MDSKFTFKQWIESISILPFPKQNKLVESVVLRLLEQYVERSDSISILYNAKFFDAVVTSSFDDLPSPIGVEILFFPFRKHYKEKTNRLYSLLHQASKESYRTLLVINVSLQDFEDSPTDDFFEGFQDLANQLPDPIKIEVWGIDKLETILQEFFESVSDLLPEIAQESTVKVIKRASSDSWKSNNSKLLKSLSDDFHERGVFLFLGAGCSASAKLPNWSNLVNKLLFRLIDRHVNFDKPPKEKDKQNLAKALNLIETSPLLLTRNIRGLLESTFESDLKDILYEDTEETIILEADLLKQLTRLCVHRPPGVVGVVTYNFDDLLEIHFENAGLNYQIICDDQTGIINDSLPVYHVHGFIPFRDEWRDKGKNGLLVFSEDGYNKLYNDPYFWANIIQLNCLRERTCVFIGLSLTDPSIRRILDAVSKNIVGIARHYILLRRMSTDDFVKEAKRKEAVNLDIKQSKNVLDVYHELQQDTLKKLGLNVIWYENHEEVPIILNAIKTKDFDLKT